MEKRDALIAEGHATAARVVADAEIEAASQLDSLDQEGPVLEHRIDELRTFEREYRQKLKGHIEGLLRELDATADHHGDRQIQSPRAARRRPDAASGASRASDTPTDLRRPAGSGVAGLPAAQGPDFSVLPAGRSSSLAERIGSQRSMAIADQLVKAWAAWSCRRRRRRRAKR